MSASYSTGLVVNGTALPERRIGEHRYVEVPGDPCHFSVRVTNHTSTIVGFWMWVDGVKSPVWRYVSSVMDVDGFEVSDTKCQQFRFAKPTVPHSEDATASTHSARSADGGHIGCIELAFWPLTKVEPYDVTIEKSTYDHVRQLAAPTLDQCSSGEIMLKVASELGEFKAKTPARSLKWKLDDGADEPIFKTKLFYRPRMQLDVLEDLHGPPDAGPIAVATPKRQRVSVVVDLT